MKAVVLAGGEGLRLREIIRDIPKPMAPVAGRPFLEYVIAQLRRWNFSEIILATGYKSSAIESFFGDGSRCGVRIRYSREDAPLGTGGALRLALQLVDDDPFVLLNGDSFADVNFDELLAFHSSHRAVCTVGLVSWGDASRYGKVEVNDNGEVTAFIEKAPGVGYINCGIYAFGRSIRENLPPYSGSLEREVLPSLIGRGLFGMPTKSFFVDIGVPEDYRSICKSPENLLPGRRGAGDKR